MSWWPSADGNDELCEDQKLKSGSGLLLLSQHILDTVILKGGEKSLSVYTSHPHSSSAMLALWLFYAEWNSTVQ